ncbi:phage portal protein [Curtobacterium sp. MCLR17_036]|uniref:phage portal protein n=1 Tax=Curtobacterium sp. MCLR17_036 TaxID=2175620 RepID=UPI0015E88CB0|nr:phage portal protein [Curtobacterium sp. MCLR17_036]WIE65946.1 phage portal protein [Curtobacterium sp. MCLR17_036]
MSVALVTWQAPRFVTNVSDAELDIIRQLFVTLAAKYPRNVMRSMYFDAKMPLQPTGNIPEEAMRKIKAVLDWPEKAVSALAERSVFEGFVTPGGDQDPFDLFGILDANRFDLELPQAITSAYKHACSFITTTLGDTAAGEPEVLVMARSAEWSTAIWDKRRRMVSSALTVTETTADGQPSAMDVWLPDAVLSMTRRPSGSWVTERQPNPLGEVLIEPLTFDPQLDRPFGRSRITRPVMNITDHALTTIVRTEISADFYAAPRMMALGVTQDAFTRGKWQAAIDRWFAISKDEDGDVPTVQQFPQMTMQPLTDLYRMYATQFSGATGVPVANLGIVTDNPPSAEALFADDRRLVSTAKRQNRIMASSLRRVAQKIVRLRDASELTPELQRIDASWANPAFTSPTAAADALQKLSLVFPWLGESEVALEFAGFSQTEITRLLSDKRRGQTTNALSTLSALGKTTGAAAGDNPS